MSLFTFTDTPRFQPLAYLRSVFALFQWKPAINAESEKESRERRDFLLELMQSHLDVFQSEMDYHNTMHFYPWRV
jgi:hypothetical protein